MGTKRVRRPYVIASINWRSAFELGLVLGGKEEYRELGVQASLYPSLKEFFEFVDRDCRAILHEEGTIKVVIQWEPKK